jgi:hypothetical protein
MFSMIDCTLRNPYPYKNADRLAKFTGHSANGDILLVLELAGAAVNRLASR